MLGKEHLHISHVTLPDLSTLVTRDLPIDAGGTGKDCRCSCGLRLNGTSFGTGIACDGTGAAGFDGATTVTAASCTL